MAVFAFFAYTYYEKNRIEFTLIIWLGEAVF